MTTLVQMWLCLLLFAPWPSHSIQRKEGALQTRLEGIFLAADYTEDDVTVTNSERIAVSRFLFMP